MSAIRALDDEFVRHLNGGDAGKLMEAFYAEEAVLLPPNHPAVSGRANIRKFWHGLLEAGLTDVAVKTTQIDVSDDLAYGTGKYTLAVCLPTGERVRDSGKCLLVYRREPNGCWKVVADMFSPDEAEA